MAKLFVASLLFTGLVIAAAPLTARQSAVPHGQGSQKPRVQAPSDALRPSTNLASQCALGGSDIERGSRTSGVLRADPAANDTANGKIASDLQRECSVFSAPSALQSVRLRIADNNIIVTGQVAADSDELQLLRIVHANADGRTVFNRLQVASPASTVR
jgi:hypothetical protein